MGRYEEVFILNDKVTARLEKMTKALEPLNKKLVATQKKFEAFERRTEGIKKLGDGMTSLGGKLTVGVTLPVVAMGGAMVKAAADIEAMQQQLSTMLGSAEAGGKMFEEIKTMAAKTPFETKDRVQFEFSQYVKLGKVDKIAEKLAEGADPYQPWHNGLDALQNVCLQGKADLVAGLLKNKVDPAKCKTAQPHSDPRHIAVLKGDAKILSLLLQYDSSQKDSGKSASMDDLTVFILSRIRYDKTPDQVIALLTAVIKHDKTWDANRPVAGKSLLYHCLSAYTKHQYTKRKVVEFLLQHKADPETKDIENIWLPSDIKRLLGKH